MNEIENITEYNILKVMVHSESGFRGKFLTLRINVPALKEKGERSPKSNLMAHPIAPEGRKKKRRKH